ncbi:MAG: CDGSH iron-sulfur domain-containing protein [Candidatus Thiodiazotropha sp. (ex Monitilora ramsayi)]|nr:CDGSH iron-sulfur domain-containing protein [Candidatus Thiodiazotropha sp. (ex Monitilora ramsayi)]
MCKPTIADTKPIGVELQQGEEYYWCACGQSQNQPFCDGSHRGSDFTPQPFKVSETGEAWLCMCKHSKTSPYCDGTHAKLTTDQEDIAEASSTTQSTLVEPTLERIHQLAKSGLEQVGHHGEMTAMGVPRSTLPLWDDIQILPAQFARKPLMEKVEVGTELVIGPNTKKPLVLDIPLFVSDMSFGALSEEAKIALSRGAELSGTGICSGEGGMLPEEQQNNSRYFYELASAMFGYSEEQMTRVQAFHFKGGQGAKTGTGGHLPGAKVTEKIAQVRGLSKGQDAISPPTFTDLTTPEDYRLFADRVRELSGGIPIGFKMSANHIEADIDFALAASADYLILDGRGGGTGAAPLLFCDHISVPTIPALARARKHLDQLDRKDVTLIITGGLRVAEDFIKSMALGADGIALSNSALQAIGCVAARMCNTNNCPSGIATQKPELRKKLDIDEAAKRLNRFFDSSVELMSVMARACGHGHLNQFTHEDISTWDKRMSEISGINFSGL